MKKQFVKVLSIMMALAIVLGMFGSFGVLAAEPHAHDDSTEETVDHEHEWNVVVDELTCDVNGKLVDGCIYRECTVEGCDENGLIDCGTCVNHKVPCSTTQTCSICNGTGEKNCVVKGCDANGDVKCGTCNGAGKVASTMG